MKSLSKRTRIGLTLLPLIVVAVMFALAFLAMNWYQNSLYDRLKNSSHDANLIKEYNELDRKIEYIYHEDLVIFDGEDPYATDETLINYFKYSLNKTSDYAFVFRLKDDKLKVLFSSAKSVKESDLLTDKNSQIIDDKTMKNLVSKKEYFVDEEYDNHNSLFKLFRYFPNSDLVICVGSVREKYSITHDRYMSNLTKDIDNTRRYILFIELMFSFLAALLLSSMLRRASLDYEDSELRLEKANESLKLTNETLQQQLLRNSTTHLPNERKLRQDLKKLYMPKLILIDIDEYRKIKEFYSHEVADIVILFIKRTLLRFCQKYNEYGMKLYYTNTGQFALLEDAPLDTERYEILANKLVKRFKGARVKTDDENKFVEFTCTIGFSLEDENSYETAITALRRAREQERDYICYFKNLDEYKEYKEQMDGADFIKRALERDKVVPFYQPIFDRDKNIIKYECLVRIVGKDKKVVSPWAFLEISRRLKKYTQIEKSLIKKSLKAIYGTDKKISINLSSRDMTDGDVSRFIIEEITKYDLANQVIFEILEDENIESASRVTNFINRVKSMGIKIAIDDFGSGYSNFSYMLSLRPDYIKVDGSLIKNIHEDKKSYAIVSSILHFAKELEIPTIAEYVHNKEVYDICMELGFNEFQGFYLGEPKENMV